MTTLVSLRRLLRCCLIAACLFIHTALLAQSGIDCECSATGAFIGPDEGEGVEISQDSISPNGIYRVEATGTGPYDVVVRRISDNAQVFATSLPSGYWGFSPDDHRFLYHYLVDTFHTVVLMDLSVSPAQQRWETGVTVSGAVVLFSPYGDYLLYAAETSTNFATIDIIEAATGDEAYHAAFAYVPAPDDDAGMVGWGFSPDSSSRSFVYSYRTGLSQVEWTVVNLESGSVVQNASLSVISSFWQFSPCGDVIGIVDQTSLTMIDARLYRTRTGGGELYSGTHTLTPPVEMRSTAASHILKVGTTDHVMSANVADDVCMIVPVELRLDPRSLTGGNPSTGTVVLNFPAAPGGTLVDLLSGNTGVATVPADVTVPEGDTTADFTVQTVAVGAAVNVVISATADGVTQRDTLTVLPIAVSGLAPASPTVIGGDSTTAVVTLSSPAGPGGSLVNLGSSDTSLAVVPSGVTVPQGSAEAQFTIFTSPVVDRDSVVISASRGGVTMYATITVLPYPEIRLQEDTIVGGNSATLIASLAGPAPAGGVPIDLQSSDPSVAEPDAQAYIPDFDTIGTAAVQTYGVAAPADVVITAPDAPFPRSATLHVLPANLNSIAALSSGGCYIPETGMFTKRFVAGNPIRVSVMLDGQAPAAGAHVTMSVDRPNLVAVLDSADIPGFEFGIEIACLSSLALSGPEDVVLTATYNSVSVSDTITIVPVGRYTFVAVYQPGDAFAVPVDLNNGGTVLISTPGGCYLWQNGVRTAVPCGAAINDSGWIAGTTYAAGIGTGFLRRGDSTITIPHPDTNYRHSVVTALNNRGDVALRSGDMTGQGPTMFSLWNPASGLFTPGDIDPYSLNVLAINDSGQAAGTGEVSGTPNPTPMPFFWSGTSLALIPLAADLRGTAWGLNNQGVVVGGYRQATGTYAPGWFRADGGNIEYFGPLPEWNRAVAFDINDDGTVVGSMGITDSYQNMTAFVYRDGMMYDLNCLASIPDGWWLSSAQRINEAGEILGFAGDVLLRAFLLKPDALTGVRDDPPAVFEIPAEFRLFQNFPNPFNPSTTIRFDLPEPAHVTLRVFDMLGREVATLFNGRKEAGSHQAVFDAAQLPSGVYHYRLSDGTSARTMKLMVIR
jgi:probable HAF family extracellular repeat protein